MRMSTSCCGARSKTPSPSIAGGPKRTARAAVIFRLTWAGQEFADSVRDESTWRKVTDVIIRPGASWTFSILAEILRDAARAKLTGIEKLF